MNPFDRAREMVAAFERDTTGLDADGSDMQRYDETRTNYGDESWEFVREMAAQTGNPFEAAQQFVKEWAGSGLAYELIGDYDCTLNCGEADAFAGLFRAFGYDDIARWIIQAHAEHDEPGEGHFIGPLEQGWES